MMMKRAIWLAMLPSAAFLTTNANAAGAKNGAEGASLIEYAGYSNCVELKNATTRVVLGHHCGGRVLEYSWKGRNAIYLDPEQNGWTYEPGKPTIGPTGGRMDIGPERIQPKRPDLWLGPWKAEIIGPRAARMISVEDRPTSVQLTREFHLDADSSRLLVKQIMRNVSDRTVRCYHWSRTLTPGGGVCLVPLSSYSRLPSKFALYGPGPILDYSPEDPNIREREGFLEIFPVPGRPKLAIDSTAGWFSYLMPNDLLFIKTFPVYPDRVYGDLLANTISIYYIEKFCELEPLGPLEILKPGQSASFTEEWRLAPYPFPPEGKDVDLGDLTRFVQELSQ